MILLTSIILNPTYGGGDKIKVCASNSYTRVVALLLWGILISYENFEGALIQITIVEK